MTSPTFKKATDTAPGTSAMYGAPDVKYAFDVLDGTHPTDRIQSSVIEHNIHAYDVIVYQIGSTTYARRGATGVLVSSSGSTPQTVIQAAIDQGPGTIYIDSGTYNFTAAFTGLEIKQSFTTVKMAPDAHLRVPADYTGAVFLLNTTRNTTDGYIEGAVSTLLTHDTKKFQKVKIEGGILGDQAATTSQPRSWTGVRVYGSVNGTSGNTIRNLHIQHCATGIELLIDNSTGTDAGNLKNTQYMEYNTFENIWIWDFDIGVNFKVHASVTPTTGVGGFHRNTLSNITMQPGDNVSPRITPTYGFKDVRHDHNAFYNCHCDDFGGASISANVHSTSRKTMIFGGSMNALNYADVGENTKLIPLAETADSLFANYLAETFGGSDYPSYIGQRGQGTKSSPSAVIADDTLLELTGRGHNSSAMSADRAWIKMHSLNTWTTASNPTYIDFATTPNASVLPTSRLKIHPTGDLAMDTTKRLYMDGPAGTGDTYIVESSGNVFQIVSGGAVIYEARSTHALPKAFVGAADPTTTDVPTGYFALAKNTTGTPTYKFFYNDAGTLKSWGASDTVETLTNKTITYAANTLTGVVGETATQTLTNKTIAFGSNTLTDVASTNTAQTLTNKTVNATGTVSLSSTGHIAMAATKKLFVDGTADTGNTYLHESAADILQLVAGGTTTLEGRSTHVLGKGFVGASNPSTTDIPDGYFAVARNTTSGNLRVFYNNAGTITEVGSTGAWNPSATETLTNKTISYSNNTLPGVMPLPEARRVGGYNGGASTAFFGFCNGMSLNSYVNTPTISHNTTTIGKYTRWVTAAINSSTGGHSTGADAIPSVVRLLGVRFKCKFRINQADTAHRIFIGLKSATGNLTGDTPIANTSGIFLFKTAAATVWSIMTNAGGATATTTNLTAPNYDLNTHTIEFKMTSGDTGWDWNYDDGAETATNIQTGPASGTALYPVVMIEGNNKTLDLWWWIVETSI